MRMKDTLPELYTQDELDREAIEAGLGLDDSFDINSSAYEGGGGSPVALYVLASICFAAAAALAVWWF